MIAHETVQDIVTKLKEDPENTKCFDCNRPDPDYASLSHGIFLCFSCAGNHRTLGPEIGEIKPLKLEQWDLAELRQLVAGGNSAFGEFLSYYKLRSEPSMYVKYRTRAAMFYRNMLKTLSNNQTYVAFMPSYELGRMVNHEIKIANISPIAKEPPTSIELQEIKQKGEEAIKPIREKEGFCRFMRRKYEEFVRTANMTFEAINEIGNTPSMRRLEVKSLIFAETYDRLFSVFSNTANEVCLEDEPTEITRSEIFYRRVYAESSHTFDSINSDPSIQQLKLELMERISPSEFERKAIDENVLIKMQLSRHRTT